MKKLINFIKKHKIFVGIVSIILFIFGYSHYTSYRYIKEVHELVNSTSFITIDIEEKKTILANLGYKIDDYIDIYKQRIIEAKKDNSYLEITVVNDEWIEYVFFNTEKSITPMFEGINWNDSMQNVKWKLGINFFNTRFNTIGILGMMKTNIFSSKNNISTRHYEGVNCSMSLIADDKKEEKVLERIRVVYDLPK